MAAESPSAMSRNLLGARRISFERCAKRMADAGVALTVLPSTDLYLMNRHVKTNTPRGVTHVHRLTANGVNCSLSTNNVLNPFTPFGDCSLIRMANLYANVCQVGAKRDIRDCFDMITTRSARLMRLNDYGLEVGKSADLVVLDCTEPESAVAELVPPLLAFKRGRTDPRSTRGSVVEAELTEQGIRERIRCSCIDSQAIQSTSRNNRLWWLLFICSSAGTALAADIYLPIVMPITGFLSVEGGSQRNGAVMALETAKGITIDYPVFDTGTSATGAAAALDKALSQGSAIAAASSIFGTEMVAMKPVAEEYKVPLLTISGLAALTESGSNYIFRFLPNDREIKVAHARYVVGGTQEDETCADRRHDGLWTGRVQASPGEILPSLASSPFMRIHRSRRIPRTCRRC